MDHMEKNTCRMCKSSNIQKFLDLGFSALSDGFLTKEQLKEPETFFPLTVNFCSDCGLCQLGYVMSPELMFNEDYPYDSSTTKTGRGHFTLMASDISEKYKFSPKGQGDMKKEDVEKWNLSLYINRMLEGGVSGKKQDPLLEYPAGMPKKNRYVVLTDAGRDYMERLSRD